MIKILYTDEFARRFTELPNPIKRKAERKEALFRKNPFHPSLKTEKLKPREKEYWSFRLDRNYRIIFRFLNEETTVFLTCGHHNWIYRYTLTH